MLDVRERLASHLYRSGLDTDPDSAPAMAVDFNDALWWKDTQLYWSVDGRNLALYPGTPLERVYPLDGTIGELAAQLTADGFDVTLLNPDLANVSAGVLLNPARDERRPSGQAIHVFQSDLWTLLDAYGVEIVDASVSAEAAIQQLYLTAAESDILDFWGEFFVVPRTPGESDDAYRARMIAEVFRPRSNPLAIQNAIKADTGFDVTIREPWRELFLLGQSALSDADHFQDGSFFTWNVLQPIYHSNLSVAERGAVIDVINRNRPAGCVLLGELAQPPLSYASANLAFAVSSKLTATYFLGWLHFTPGVVSSSLALSDYSPDQSAPFLWKNFGDVAYAFGADPLNLFTSSGWEGGWGDSTWFKGSASAVVTQHSV